MLAYDGTEFFGFQRQRQEKGRTVQGVFEEALRQVGWTGHSILAAGRTDTGVHAAGQVVAFDLDWQHAASDLQAALNSYLPPDVAVQALQSVLPEFHPRYDAIARLYRYRIICEPWRDPLRERYAWRVWPAPDILVLRQTAQDLTGTHNFAAFGTPPRSESSTIRTVHRAEWKEDGSELVFEIEANAFLYHMVRRLVIIQVAAGQGRLEAGAVRLSLEQPPATMLQGLAPPQGLSLVQVTYAEAK